MEALPSIIAILSLTAIELMALHKGINGKLLVATSIIIAGLAGYNASGLIAMVSNLVVGS